jgi:hypothetical protein
LPTEKSTADRLPVDSGFPYRNRRVKRCNNHRIFPGTGLGDTRRQRLVVPNFKTDVELDMGELRQFSRTKLPEYMVPSFLSFWMNFRRPTE